MISIRYTITKEDYVNFYTYVMWDAPENRKKRMLFYTKQVIPIILFILAFYLTGVFDRNSRFVLIILGFIILTSILSLFGVRSNTVKQAEKVANNPGNSSIFLETTMLVSDTGINIKDILKETKYTWNSFIRKQENKDYYFLFVSSIQALIIPKAIFNNVEERTQFVKMLSQHLSFEAELGHLLKS